MSPNPITTNRPLFLLSIIGGLIIVGYALFVASPYLLGPSLEVTTPGPNQPQSGSTVTIAGQTARVAYLSINDLPVPLAEDGSFAVERAFPSGYTVLVVKARDRFGREETDTISFVLTHNLSFNVAQNQKDPEVRD